MSYSHPRRNIKIPHRIQQLLNEMYAGPRGFSGPELLSFFSNFIPDLEPYPWKSRPLPSRWGILQDCLARLDLDQQKLAIRHLLEYDGPMRDGQPNVADKAKIREWLDGGVAPPAVLPAEVDRLNWDSVNDTWNKALLRLASDPAGAITAARTLLEGVCKHILKERGVSYKDDGNLKRLYGSTVEALGLSPDKPTQSIFLDVLDGCVGITLGVGMMRNLYSDAHGRGLGEAKAAPRHARLAVNAAGTVTMFLIETHLAQVKSSGSS